MKIRDLRIGWQFLGFCVASNPQILKISGGHPVAEGCICTHTHTHTYIIIYIYIWCAICMSRTNLSDFLGVVCGEEPLTSFIHIRLGFCGEVGDHVSGW